MGCPELYRLSPWGGLVQNAGKLHVAILPTHPVICYYSDVILLVFHPFSVVHFAGKKSVDAVYQAHVAVFCVVTFHNFCLLWFSYGLRIPGEVYDKKDR